jgi:hypothetical protein
MLKRAHAAYDGISNNGLRQLFNFEPTVVMLHLAAGSGGAGRFCHCGPMVTSTSGERKGGVLLVAVIIGMLMPLQKV